MHDGNFSVQRVKLIANLAQSESALQDPCLEGEILRLTFCSGNVAGGGALAGAGQIGHCARHQGHQRHVGNVCLQRQARVGAGSLDSDAMNRRRPRVVGGLYLRIVENGKKQELVEWSCGVQSR